MTKFPINPKNPIFWPICPIFDTIFFLLNPALSPTATQHISLEHHTEFQKTQMSQYQENLRKHRKKEGPKDGQTLIHRAT